MNLVNDKGELHIRFGNATYKALLFTDEGMDVMYRIGRFCWNFVRGLGVIFCWLALLAALGLAGATFLSFPVAAFCSIGVLILAMSTGTLEQIVTEGGIIQVDPNTGQVQDPGIINRIAVPVAKGLLSALD